MTNLKTKIPVHDWNVIVTQIHKQRCVPFLGAGVNIKCGKEDSLPLGAEVALRLLLKMIRPAEEVSESSYRIKWKNLRQYRADARTALTTFATSTAAGHTKLDDASLENLLDSVLQILPDEQAKLAHIIVDESLDQYQDLTRVALQDLARVSLRYRRNKNLPDFIDELKEIIPDTKRNVPRLLRVLASMPFRLIVTTNYDRLMERSLELFNELALTQPDTFTARVKTDGTLLSRFIEQSVSDEMFDMLLHCDAAGVNSNISALGWINELNKLIQEKSLYQLKGKHLSKEDLSSELWAILDARPKSVEEVKSNRIVIEDSYPDLFKRHNKAYATIVQPIGGFIGSEEHKIQKILSQHDGVILYKLHGSFNDDVHPAGNTRPLITEEDYIEFLTYVGAQGENIDKQITATIKTSTLLFLGYSLEDWNFRALFKGLVEKVDPNYRPYSYAIQKDPSEFWVRFWEDNDRNVQIFNMDICEFTEELESKISGLRQAD